MKNSRGLTFIEVLVSVGILSIVMIAIGSFQIYQKIQLQDLVFQDMQTNFIEEIEESLSSADVCSSFLPNTATTVNVGLKVLLDISNLNNQLYTQYYKVKTAELEVLSQDSLIQDKTATNPVSFDALINFELEHVRSSRNHLLKKIVIPLKLYGSHQIATINKLSCISANSDSSIYVGQICNAYGGLMSDGMHCDLPKLKPLSAHTNASSASMSTEKIEVSNDKLQRISISEAVCYLDTLAVLTKNLPGWTGSKLYTRFCKFPGGASTAELSHVLKNSRYPNLK